MNAKYLEIEYYERKLRLIDRAFHIALLILGIAALILLIVSIRMMTELNEAIATHEPAVAYASEADLEAEAAAWASLGEFKITHYCSCEKCSGQWGNLTATGVRAKAGHTIAVDPRVIPYGSVVLIDGHEYVAEDTGGAIKGERIDIYCDSHQEASDRGVIYKEVLLKAN